MDNTFITYATSVLAETNEGLSGSKIIEYCADFAFKYGIELPHPKYPFAKGFAWLIKVFTRYFVKSMIRR